MLAIRSEIAGMPTRERARYEGHTRANIAWPRSPSRPKPAKVTKNTATARTKPCRNRTFSGAPAHRCARAAAPAAARIVNTPAGAPLPPSHSR